MRLYAVVEDTMLCDEYVVDYLPEFFRGIFQSKEKAEEYASIMSKTIFPDFTKPYEHKVVKIDIETDFDKLKKQKGTK